MSSDVKFTLSAPRFSSSRSRRRVPGIGTIHGLRARSQASAICPGVAFFLAPILDPAYFSRDYRRHFGEPPIRDVERLRGTALSITGSSK